ncbi:MAG: phytanoyl-CoA dioxygenase family protein [Gemmatimonadetes bacterium]|nr:phytanoyl-CoA dioxygenase family protein [Gemmatimonadota bacterium]
MNETERYEFDRQGYIVIEDLLDPDAVSSLSAAVDELEAHALANLDKPPRKASPWGPDYHRNPERGYHVDGSNAEGRTVIIEDFWNADERFDVLVNDGRTMAYIGGIVQGRSTINNSEIRIRYRGNLSGLHGGMRPENQKYRYGFNANGIDCMMVRMVYFIHDVSREHGAFCVIPGTHKTNVPCPYDGNPDEEPGVVALEVKAGDAILFTENLRHGGVTNRSDQVRKTIHVGYGPYWMLSQNQATMDEFPYVTEATFARWDDDQRALFKPWHRPRGWTRSSQA